MNLAHPNDVREPVAAGRLPASDLADIQGLLAYRRPAPYFGSYLLVRIDRATDGRRLLEHLLPHIPSVGDWQTTADHVCVAVAITHNGLAALGVSDDVLESFPAQLRDGMAARAEQVGDRDASAPEHWDRPFGSGEIHLALSIIAPTHASWQDQAARAIDAFDRTGLQMLGRIDFAAHPDTRTSLGYRDGISFPTIAGIPTPAGDPSEPGAPIATGEFLLGHASETGQPLAMPHPEALARNGSYLGFRKIRTDVAAFRRFLHDNAADEHARGLLAAKLLGRWPSGAPLSLAPQHDNPALAADPSQVNTFGYSEDPQGLVCPHGAHIRRVNPRDSPLTTLTDPRIHRILRQGTVYGAPLPDGELNDDGKDRGIIFMFISARAHTLEFLKSQWLNDGHFTGLGDEQDPLAGDHRNASQFTIPQRPIRRRLTGLAQFTTTAGGEYAFLPSLNALRCLVDLGTS